MQYQRIGGAVWPVTGVDTTGGVGHYIRAQVFADDVNGGRLAVFEAFGKHARHLRAHHRVCTAAAGAQQANEAEDENFFGTWGCSLLHAHAAIGSDSRISTSAGICNPSLSLRIMLRDSERL